MGEGETEEPFEFDDFKHEIDSRGGYLASIANRALSTDDFEEDIQEISDLDREFETQREHMCAEKGIKVASFSSFIVDENDEEFRQDNPYADVHRSEKGN